MSVVADTEQFSPPDPVIYPFYRIHWEPSFCFNEQGEDVLNHLVESALEGVEYPSKEIKRLVIALQDRKFDTIFPEILVNMYDRITLIHGVMLTKKKFRGIAMSDDQHILLNNLRADIHQYLLRGVVSARTSERRFAK